MISDLYYYHRLSKKNQILYKKIYDALVKMEPSVSCFEPGLTADDITTIYKYLYWDNPYFFYLSGNGFRLEKNSLGLITFIPEYWFTKVEVVNITRKLELNVKNLIERTHISPNDNDYTKILKIHDLICQNVTYDTNTSSNDITTKEDIYAHTILGVLLKKTAVCSGISKAFKYILNAIGLRSIVITGIADSCINDNDSSGHAWNIVKIDNSNVNIDLTWDVCLSEPHFTRYDYFCLSDYYFLKDHSPEISDAPICAETKYDYYFSNRLEISNDSELTDCINTSINSVPATLTYRINPTADFDYLFVKGHDLVLDRLFALGCNGKIAHSLNENQKVVTFFITK